MKNLKNIFFPNKTKTYYYNKIFRKKQEHLIPIHPINYNQPIINIDDNICFSGVTSFFDFRDAIDFSNIEIHNDIKTKEKIIFGR